MRWSERPPAARSRRRWLGCRPSSPCVLSVAVAHLALVRRMRVLAGIIVALVAIPVFADTRALPTLSNRDAIGVWEAIALDSTFGVYVMTISAQGDAQLVQLSVGPDKSPLTYFIGRASSYEFRDGTFKARFMMAPEHVHYLDWIEVEGSGVGEGEVATMAGKITKHRTGTDLNEWTGDIVFNKGQWLKRLHIGSKIGREVL